MSEESKSYETSGNECSRPIDEKTLCYTYVYVYMCMWCTLCFILHRYFNPSQMCFGHQSCIKTLPKAQRTQWLSVLTKVIAFNSCRKFINLDQNLASKS